MRNRRRFLLAATALITLAFVASAVRTLWRSSPLEGRPAPGFSLPVVIGGGSPGERLRLSDLRGQVVVLDFWASWCGPCRESVLELSELASQLREQGVQIIGVNSENVGPLLFDLVGKRWGFSYPTVHDADQAVLRSYEVAGFPTVVVIDREGVVARVYAGAPTKRALKAEILRTIK